jgi:hypothetical protein
MYLNLLLAIILFHQFFLFKFKAITHVNNCLLENSPLIDGLADGWGLIHHFENKNKIKFVLQRHIYFYIKLKC